MPRIVRFHETGDADVLRLDELPLAKPEAGEVRLKVEAIGLNRAEVLFRQGMYLENPELPSRIGYEAAGVVDAVGPGVSDVQIGDRVSTIPSFSMGQYGVYGESAIVPAHAVASYPDNLSAAQGAAIWMQYMTAYGALIELGKMRPDQTVLITAASSSVGLAAIQITKSVGARAVATTRGPEKKAFLLEAGADHVIVTDEEDMALQIEAVSDGKGAHMIFDPVAGRFLEKLAQAAAPGATIFEYGALSLAATPFPLFDALGKGLTVRGYTLFEIVQQPDMLQRGKAFVYDGLESGTLKPVIDSTFSLDKIADAHRYMESNRQKGKIVVTTMAPAAWSRHAV
jgi:NADPH:quinone reductase-like Zn-dependent oxidoreductase